MDVSNEKHVYIEPQLCGVQIHTLVAGLLARSQYPEFPTNGHLGTGFSSFPCVYKRMLRWSPRLQVATACLSCSPTDIDFLDSYFTFMYMYYNHCHRATAQLQFIIIIIIIIIIIFRQSACCITNRTELGANTSQSWVPLQGKAPTCLRVKPRYMLSLLLILILRRKLRDPRTRSISG